MTFRLEVLENPPVLPPFAACCAGRVLEHHHTLQFAAGRECAARALAMVDAAAAAIPVGRGPVREPLWPDGFTGSITHTGDYIAAAVARTTHAASLGLDAQQIIDEERAERIWRRIVMPDEDTVAASLYPKNVRACLLFAIKEATFKCFYPIVQRRFYFDALHVHALDPATGEFHARLTRPLADGFAAGRDVTGRFAIDEERVYSALFVPAA